MKIYYVVDERDKSMDAVEKYESLDSVKNLLLSAWHDDDEGWQDEEIERMNAVEVDEALGGIGYSLFNDKNEALKLVKMLANSEVI